MTEYQKLYKGKPVCCNCAHFYQHYRRSGRRYAIVGWGHCVTPRIKARCPGQSCEHWEKRKEEPVSKD